MAQKDGTGQVLKTFLIELDIPEELKVDGPKEKNSPGTEFVKCCRRNDISLKITDPERLNRTQQKE